MFVGADGVYVMTLPNCVYCGWAMKTIEEGYNGSVEITKIPGSLPLARFLGQKKGITAPTFFHIKAGKIISSYIPSGKKEPLLQWVRDQEPAADDEQE